MSRMVLERVAARFPHAVVSTHALLGDETVVIAREALRDVMKFLRDDPGIAMNMLVDLTCVDYLPQEPRFEVVYHLYSIPKKHRLRLKARVPEDDCAIATVGDLWRTAGWLEREAWDLYGVRFAGHPDLRRILLYEEFVGHPLRKDYPVEKRQPLARRGDGVAPARPEAADLPPGRPWGRTPLRRET